MSSWFEQVTGTSNSEREAWRNNYNGGAAVGAGASYYNDISGYSDGSYDGGGKGSSASVSKGTGVTHTYTTPAPGIPYGSSVRGGWSPTPVAPTQPGGPVLVTAPPGGYQTVTSGPGLQSGPGPGWGGGGNVVLTPGYSANVTQVVIGGHPVNVDRTMSNAEDIEERYGEAEFGSPAYFYGWGVTIADAWNDRQKLGEALGINTNDPWSGGALSWSVQPGGWVDTTLSNIGSIEGSNPRPNMSTGATVYTGGGF